MTDRIERPVSISPLPPHAKKVFDGVIFDVYQWDQEMFDGTTEVFEKLVRNDSCLVIPVTAEGMILLTEQEQPNKAPFITFAGGELDDGEDPLTGAMRELKEETGYEAEEIVLWDAFQPTGRIEWAIYIFVARNCRKAGEQQLDAGEKITVKEITFDEFLARARENDFFHEPDVAVKALQAQLDPEKMQRMRTLFFGKP